MKNDLRDPQLWLRSALWLTETFSSLRGSHNLVFDSSDWWWGCSIIERLAVAPQFERHQQSLSNCSLWVTKGSCGSGLCYYIMDYLAFWIYCQSELGPLVATWASCGSQAQCAHAQLSRFYPGSIPDITCMTLHTRPSRFSAFNIEKLGVAWGQGHGATFRVNRLQPCCP